MPVQFKWGDETKTVMSYTATGADWNWADFHRTVHLSLFQLVNVDHPVHTLADFRPTTRFPGGAVAHLRSIGKKREHTHFSGKVALVGVPDEVRVKITGDSARFAVQFTEHEVYFVADEAEAMAVLTGAR